MRAVAAAFAERQFTRADDLDAPTAAPPAVIDLHHRQPLMIDEQSELACLLRNVNTRNVPPLVRTARASREMLTGNLDNCT
jgi:hypothetical protein